MTTLFLKKGPWRMVAHQRKNLVMFIVKRGRSAWWHSHSNIVAEMAFHGAVKAEAAGEIGVDKNGRLCSWPNGFENTPDN